MSYDVKVLELVTAFVDDRLPELEAGQRERLCERLAQDVQTHIEDTISIAEAVLSIQDDPGEPIPGGE